MSDRHWLSNPAVAEYEGETIWGNRPVRRDDSIAFTIQGAAAKLAFLLLVLGASFAYTWEVATQGYAEAYATLDSTGNFPDAITLPNNVVGLAFGGVFAGLVLALIIIFNKKTAPYLSPLYAASEGLALGAISAGVEARYPGVVLQSIAATIGTAFGMATIYSLGLVKPTRGFVAGLVIAGFGIVSIYLVDVAMQCFGSYIPLVHSAGPWGIVFQFFVVGVAAFFLIADFGTVTEAAENRAPRSYEWYAGFSILVTLVWLYLEILNLYMKLQNKK